MKLTIKLVSMLAVVASALMLSSAAAAEGWFSDMDDPKEVTLGEVIRDPHAFVEVPIILTVYFDQKGWNYNPYYTRFDDVVYGNFSAWPINARLFEKRDYGRPYPFFFMQRVDKHWKKLSKLDRMQVVELTCIVRDVFHGQPWIEVLDYDKESYGLRVEDVRNIVAGDGYFLTGRYKKAVEHYEDAAHRRIPGVVKAEVYRKLADAQFHAGEYRDAADSYRTALKAAPKSKVLEQGLAAARDMAERKRRPSVAKERAHIVARPAVHTVPVISGAANDVDEIIRVLEDARKVDVAVARDRFKLEKAAARARRGETAIVKRKKPVEEPKEAAVEGEGPVEDGTGVKEPEKAPEEERAEQPEENTEAGETSEGVENEKVEEPVEEEVVEAGQGALVKDDELRPGEVLVKDGVPVEDEKSVEEKGGVVVEKGEVAEDVKTEETGEKKADEAGEEKSEEAGEDVKTEEAAKEKTEEAAEEKAEEDVKTEEAAEETAEKVDEEKAEEAEEAAEEKAEEVAEDETEEKGVENEGDKEAEEKVVEEMTEEPAEDEGVEKTEKVVEEKAEEVVEDERPEEVVIDESEATGDGEVIMDEGVEVVDAEEAVVVKDGEVVVKDGEAVVVKDGEVVEDEAVAVPVRLTVDQLPRLPFHGCEDVTPEELRRIIEDVLNNPQP